LLQLSSEHRIRSSKLRSVLYSLVSWVVQLYVWEGLQPQSPLDKLWAWLIACCRLQIADCSRRIVNHSSAACDLRILLVFFQHPAWFISLQTIKTCGILLNNKLVITLKSLTCLQECQKQVSGTCFTRPSS